MSNKAKIHKRQYAEIYKDFWLISPEILSYFDKCVFATIKEFANSDEQAFPSITKIVNVTGISKSRVLKSIKNLTDLGFVQKKKRKREGTEEYTSNEYHIYDTPQMCAAGQTAEEIKQASKMSEREYWLEKFRKEGLLKEDIEKETEEQKVEKRSIEKELPSAGTDESSALNGRVDNDDDNYQDKDNTNQNTNQELTPNLIAFKQMLDKYCYPVLIHDYPLELCLINDVMTKLFELRMSKNPTIRIGGDTFEADYVKTQLDKLDHFMIIDAIHAFQEASKQRKIKNPLGYLMKCIWNNISGFSTRQEAKYNNDSYL